MAKDVSIDIQNFKIGFERLDDESKTKPGSLRLMRNAMVTDRGGLSPRPGVTLLGTSNSNGNPIRGFYNFKKSFGEDEILIKTYDDELEGISKTQYNDSDIEWFRIKSGFTSGKEFGFATSLVNTSNEDLVVFSNRYEPYQTWTGEVTLLNGALAGGETAITVDSVLFTDVFETATATGSSATTLTVSGKTYADDQWNTFYVYITSGVHAGKIRLITDTASSTTITFNTLGSDPGSCSFEIRRAKFPATGTLIYNNTTIAYTAIPTATTFTVASAHAATDNTPVMLVPTTYDGLPRGNRITNYLNRMVVGNVRSAMARGSGGALQGYASGGSFFVSKINNHTDFGYSATRVAGEGDVVSAPYGGGEITDVQTHEDSFYVFKERYIEAVQYTQDINDLVSRTPLKAGAGSAGKTIKGSDDIYFVTADKKFTSIGRVRTKDTLPQTENIGFKIKRYLDNCNVDDVGRGAEIQDKLYIPLKSNSTVAQNDVLLVYNKNSRDTGSGRGYFEGVWELPVFAIEQWNNKWYFAESNGANVYEMLTTEKADIVGETRYPIVSEVATQFMNLTASKANLQAMSGLFCEGWIRAGSTVVYNVWKDFADTPFLTITFVVDEDGYLDGEESSVFLGGNPLALNPLSSIVGEPDADGRRHFSFTVRFPFQYANYFSVGQYSDTADTDYETTRFSLFLKEEIAQRTDRIKPLST